MAAQPLVVAQTMLLRIFNDREPVFCADQVGELADCPIASDEIAELVCTVKGRGVPVNMIVNVCFVGVGANDKRMIAFKKRSANS